MFKNQILKCLLASPKFFSTKPTLMARKRGPNPGLNRHLKELNNSGYKNTEVPESLEEFESDFMSVHQTYKQHEQETNAYKEFIRLKVVQNKYFKENYPNFLTFAEKEQIRLLNSREPDEWTPEKLSESFPADEITIRKIIKARWYPHEEKRLRKHDEKVIENWDKFRKGELSNLPNNLKEHLQKFSSRNTNDLKNLETKWVSKRPEIPKPKTNEFSSIITNCKGYQEKKLIEDNDKIDLIESNNENEILINNFGQRKNLGEKESFIMGKINNKLPITLSTLKNQAGIVPESETNKCQIEFNPFKNDNDENVQSESNSIKKFEFSEISINNTDIKKYNVALIKEKIYIPKNLWKKGATYKVEDCYYDYDGTFLYRVPGMTGKANS